MPFVLILQLQHQCCYSWFICKTNVLISKINKPQTTIQKATHCLSEYSEIIEFKSSTKLFLILLYIYGNSNGQNVMGYFGHTVLFLICAVHIYNIPLSDTALQCFGAIFPCGQKPIKVSSKGSFIAAPNLIYLNSFSQTSKLILTLQLMI